MSRNGAGDAADEGIASTVVAGPNDTPTVAETPQARTPRGPVRTLTADHGEVRDLGSWTGDGRGRYVLGNEIARGGGGRVVSARDLRLGREVAAKLPLEEPGSLERLVREAQLISQLEHASIVPVHDLSRDEDGTPFYVMKLLDGETLRARIAGRPFEERIALLPTLIQICDAVAYAHHLGIVHRDLKPGNVIVGRFGETSVIDWGLAQRADEIADAGSVVGTPAYMPPEQARGEAVDVRADVYGLGALLYHVLGGDAPYPTGDTHEVIAAVLAKAPTALRDREPRLPADLAAIVAKAMARERDARYADAGQLADDLRRYQSGRLVAAHRYSVPQRIRRWIRRHRVALAAGTLATAAAAAIVIAWPSRGPDARAMCSHADDVVTAAWTPAKRAALEEHVHAGAGPGAPTIAAYLGGRLDAYARSLGAARISACEATHVRGEQSADLLDRRMSCLDGNVDTLVATIALFDKVDPAGVTGLTHAVEQLTTLTRCDDREALLDVRALPSEPAARDRAVALRAKVTAGRAALDAGRFTEALAAGQAILPTLAPDAHPPFAALAHLLVGGALQELDREPEALPELRKALTIADAAHDDDTRAGAVFRLAMAAVDGRQHDEAEVRLAELDAIATRLDDPVRRRLRLDLASQLAKDRGDYVGALDLAKQSLALAEASGNLEQLAYSHAGVARILVAQGSYKDAEAHLQKSLEYGDRVSGPEHPNHARRQVALGAVLFQTGRADEAVAVLNDASRRFDAAGMGATTDSLAARSNLAGAYMNGGKLVEARRVLEEVYQLNLQIHGPDAPQVTRTLLNLGNVDFVQNDWKAAEEHFRAAVAHGEKNLGKDHPTTAGARYGLGATLTELGRYAEALVELRAAFAVHIQQSGPDSDDVAYDRHALARALLNLGQPAAAFEQARLAMPFYETFPEAKERGSVRWIMAQAMERMGKPRAAVIEMAQKARADFVQGDGKAGIEEVDKLLARLAHPVH